MVKNKESSSFSPFCSSAFVKTMAGQVRRCHPPPKSLFIDLMFNNPDLGAKQIWQIYGFKTALDNIDIRELPSMHSHFSERTWFRLLEDVNKVKLLPRTQNSFKVIRDQLEKLEPLKMPMKL